MILRSFIKEKAIKLADTYYLDLSADVNNTIDRRLAIAATIMMDIGEHTVKKTP